MDDDLRKLVATKLAEAVKNALEPFGRALASGSARDAIITVGERGDDGRRWIAVLATNDAADHVERHADEQAAGRDAASKAAGMATVRVDKTGKGSDQPPPRG